jgi:hypothetical protein
MRGEYYAALEIENAIVDGRLTDAREKATWIATHGDQLDPPATKNDELIQAADTIATSQSVLDAAGGLARLGHACASCHVATGAKVDLAFVKFRAPEGDASLHGQMLQHSWAAERLWQGMLAPSDTAWSEGADLLAKSAIDLSATTRNKPNAEAAELAERLKFMAQSATHAAPAERSLAFGEIIVACARCHDVVRVHPVIGDR